MVDGSAGYAAFANLGIRILFAGGGSGKGLAVNNKTKMETFMRMAEVHDGLGMGAKKFRVVFIFETEDALNNIINAGWEFGGQASAAATSAGEVAAYRGAASVSPGVWM